MCIATLSQTALSLSLQVMLPLTQLICSSRLTRLPNLESNVHRFADFAVHPVHTWLIVAILEDHTYDAALEIQNSIVVIDSRNGEHTTVVQGADFYSTPRFSPDGKHLAWKQWSVHYHGRSYQKFNQDWIFCRYHPDLPWMGSVVMLTSCELTDEGGLSIVSPTPVAGKNRKVAVGELNWLNNDTLIFTSDQTGYANPWRYSVGSEVLQPMSETPIDEDFAEPSWLRKSSTSSFFV